MIVHCLWRDATNNNTTRAFKKTAYTPPRRKPCLLLVQVGTRWTRVTPTNVLQLFLGLFHSVSTNRHETSALLHKSSCVKQLMRICTVKNQLTIGLPGKLKPIITLSVVLAERLSVCSVRALLKNRSSLWFCAACFNSFKKQCNPIGLEWKPSRTGRVVESAGGNYIYAQFRSSLKTGRPSYFRMRNCSSSTAPMV